ncbi:MAG: carbohydrate porin [Gammaproteobacteria bacterium]|nr:carbohydrate porin [Gammaproteobacteria bacterium]
MEKHRLTQKRYRLFYALLISFFCSSTVLATQSGFAYHGYFRSSMGISQDAKSQSKFQLPGARAKYRLGNEPDTNMELQLDYVYALSQSEKNGANIKSVIMLDGYATQGESNGFALGHLAQAYFSFNQFTSNATSLWMGRRYYQRKSVHIMNHFWLNPGQNSHAGIGVENFKTGPGKLDIALFRNEDNVDANASNVVNSTVADFRWHSLTLSDPLKLTLWAQAALRGAVPVLSYENKTGYAFGYWLDYKTDKLKNTLMTLFQQGATITQSGTNPRAVREDLGWNLDSANIVEVNNQLTLEASPYYAFQFSLLYRRDDRGTAGNNLLTWFSSGIRPLFYLSQHLNLALETGLDYVKDEVNQRSGGLGKFTAALQIAADRGFKSRPVLRMFVTLAQWSESFRGLVGNIPGNSAYANSTRGWTVGSQVESWW